VAICLFGLLATGSIPAAGCRKEAAQDVRMPDEASVPVKVATAVEDDVPVELREVARVEPYNTVTLQSRVQGAVTEIHFVDGQDVKTGDLLFVIDPRPFQAAVHQAEANLIRDKAQAVEAQKRAAQYEEAYRKNAAAQLDYDQNRATAEAAVATVRADEAALENARLQLEYCTIRSPIDGKVGERLTDLGNMVTPNVTPLVLINQLRPIYVTFSVPERYLSRIHEQMAAGRLTVEAAIPGDNGPPERGVLTFLDNRVNAATGTIRLIGTFANEDRRLWPGQFVHATLLLAVEKNAVVIPSEAVQAARTGDAVYVIRPDHTAESRSVVLGRTVGGRIVIKQGLKAGEVVVTEGQLRLVPGANVEIEAATTRPASRASSEMSS
jgi:multidrug efflux system membrane fusion protein